MTNSFERDPVTSRNALLVQRAGGSSEVVVVDALRSIERPVARAKPYFAVIWYGKPHTLSIACEEDRLPFGELDERFKHYYGELVAMDRSIGTVRARLGALGVERNTLMWFTTDNAACRGWSRRRSAGCGGSRGVSTRAAFVYRRSSNGPPESRSPG